MLKVFQNFFATNLYVKISANKFEAKNLSYNEDNHWQVLHALAPFTNDRLLVAHFVKAETVLQPFIKQLLPKSLIPKSFRILVHPLSHIEGGLSDIEERVLKELILGVGAFKVVLHIGEELDDMEAIDLLNSVE